MCSLCAMARSTYAIARGSPRRNLIVRYSPSRVMFGHQRVRHFVEGTGRGDESHAGLANLARSRIDPVATVALAAGQETPTSRGTTNRRLSSCRNNNAAYKHHKATGAPIARSPALGVLRFSTRLIPVTDNAPNKPFRVMPSSMSSLARDNTTPPCRTGRSPGPRRRSEFRRESAGKRPTHRVVSARCASRQRELKPDDAAETAA